MEKKKGIANLLSTDFASSNLADFGTPDGLRDSCITPSPPILATSSSSPWPRTSEVRIRGGVGWEGGRRSSPALEGWWGGGRWGGSGGRVQWPGGGGSGASVAGHLVQLEEEGEEGGGLAHVGDPRRAWRWWRIRRRMRWEGRT